MIERASIVFLATVGLFSCESAGGDPPLSKAKAPSSDQESREPIATADSIRPKPSASRPTSMELIDVDKGQIYVGRLVRNEVLSVMHPSEYCLEDGKIWKGAAYRIGRVNVFGVDRQLSKMAAYSPVVVFGGTKSDLSTKLQIAGPCPDNYEPIQIQMRSDWVSPEKGPNTTRGVLQKLSYIEGQSAKQLLMTEFLPGDADTVIARIRNPFNQPMDSLSFRVHYEGGPGKTSASYVKKVLSLNPGEWTEIELPKTRSAFGNDDKRRKSGSGLHSLEFRGTLGNAQVELEITIPHS